jgi:hypothetical protein
MFSPPIGLLQFQLCGYEGAVKGNARAKYQHKELTIKQYEVRFSFSGGF